MKVVDRRSAERIAFHYLREVAIFEPLRKAASDVARSMYIPAYQRLFSEVTDHPQLVGGMQPLRDRVALAARQAKFLHRINPGNTFLEVGAGDCLTTLIMGGRTKTVYAVDVAELPRPIGQMLNFNFVLSDGTSVLPTGTQVSLAFSNQLMEHLREDHALEQLQNIYRALLPGGKYFCITPNRLSGPHDVSQHFADEAQGAHLKEYTCDELVKLFREAGFARVTAYVGRDGLFMRIPMWVVRLTERFVAGFPGSLRKRVGQLALFRLLLGLRLMAHMPQTRGSASCTRRP